MMLVLSGEGPTDLGRCRTPAGNCSGGEFEPGPLCVIVDKLLEPALGYHPLELPDRVHFIHKTALSHRARAKRHGYSLVGKKRGQETGDFYIAAWMLGEIALEMELANDDLSIAVLHRDSDERADGPNDVWDRKHRSILDGFARASYARGVPLLPKPISESWLLCLALPGMASCAALEDESASERSPRPLKRQLDEALGGHQDAGELASWIEDAFDADRLSIMPSFAQFRERLASAMVSVLAGQ
jgi:hypothetical protein